ncbi:nickel pincer cofactor biosynthesis protein LarC [Adlercreutzia shanghongiae]|uniref:LarC family nickel insertion protein n=1 Tax=Adlercreutzia shanghongiae TaxID=3111773 RepID=A0ABU6J0Q8_9ACTN|nr:LarC family nickel insertion protein [Adlercreutzia sp. R22]MEC4295583.1 LarC family nickel insertion protein [Adlercreutzia sp. R22]
MTKLLYLECTSGISGDMCAAALIDAGASEQAVREALGSLPVEGFAVEISRVVKSGLDVCDFKVVLDAAHENHDHDMAYLHGRERDGGHGHEHEHGHGHDHGSGHEHDHGSGHEHHHRGPAQIAEIIDGAAMTEGARAIAHRIFDYVAAAEARAHGVPLEQVHFHEVGAVDSIADIVAIAVAADDLSCDGVVVTDLPCGWGTVRCRHGLIPVPAPATAFIAEATGLPLAPVDVEGELVTPTGAAAAAALRTRDALPERFAIRAIGMGAGKRAYDTPGILRAMIIEPLA